MTRKKDSVKINMINQISGSNLNPDTRDEIIGQMIGDKNEGSEGVFDKIFGKRHPDLFIAWFVAIGILLTGGFCSWLFKENINMVKELWQIFTPALTLVIGYVLGNKKSN